MICAIEGKIDKIFSNKIVIKTEAGFYIEVLASPRLIAKVNLGEKIKLIVGFVATEKFLGFYGFENDKQREIFYKLAGISGIGHKLAYNIVSFAEIEELTLRAKKGDLEFFTQIPGIGKKTAKKLLVELSQVFEQDVEFSKLFLDEEDKLLLEALKTLGYNPSQIKKIIIKVEKNKPLEERVKLALKLLSQN